MTPDDGTQLISPQIQTTLVGIIGTLIGTLLGWLLNQLSQTGKLKFYIYTFSLSFYEDNKGQGKFGSLGGFSSCKYTLSLDIYNSSAQPKIMRDIQLQFSAKNKVEFTSVPYDNDSVSYNDSGSDYKIVLPLNIPAKSVLTLNAWQWIVDEDFMKMYNVKKIYLVYKDEKNKEKKIKLRKKNYQAFFDNHELDKDQDNQN